MTYERPEVKAPRLSGRALKTVAALAERPLAGALIRRQMLAGLGFDGFRAAEVDGPPTFLPKFPAGDAPGAAPDLDALLDHPGEGGPFATTADLRAAYAAGDTDPVAVAERAYQAIEASDDGVRPLRAFVARDRQRAMAEAEASRQRWQDGKPLSPLDGIPVAVKDELDVEGLPTTVGTSFLGHPHASADATVVARLRAAGAVVLGKTNMHEIGIGVTGVNPHHGACRNPYDPGHVTGGSSSGSAAAVAAGLVTMAVGADGGGSIRIPSGLCGVVGLKATFSRVSEHGAAPLCWSVAHVGPIGATARDVAAMYAVIAGADDADPNTAGQPPLTLDGFEDTDLEGVTFGVYRPWLEDADPEVVKVVDAAIAGFKAQGAAIKDIELADLVLLHQAQLCTIVSEMLSAHAGYRKTHLHDYGLDVRLNFAVGGELTSEDYVKAQRLRTRGLKTFGKVLAGVDAIVTPATAIPAPAINEASLPDGESNLSDLDAIMRFATVGNLLGYPAISFPGGYTAAGLPVGVQLIGRPWEEHRLLRFAHAAEAFVERREPKWHRRLLG